MTLADSLRRFRREFDVTQKQVAEAIGMAESGYQRYEQGRATPSVEVVERIANAYGVSVDYLLGRTDNPRAHFFEENPKATSPNFLNQIIFETRIDHAERLHEADKSGVKIDEPNMEYADLLARNIFRKFLPLLIEAGVKL